MKKNLLFSITIRTVSALTVLLALQQSICANSKKAACALAVKTGQLSELKKILPQLNYGFLEYFSAEAERQRQALRDAINVRYDDEDGGTLLHMAARVENAPRYKTVKFLIANGAEVDALDDLNRTPLAYALANDSREIINILIAKGADHGRGLSGCKKILEEQAAAESRELEKGTRNFGKGRKNLKRNC